MKMVCFTGSLESRLVEEITIKPNPMVKIGEKTIIEHIKRWNMNFSYCEFIICLGYKGSRIIDHFKNYHRRNSTITIYNNGKLETLEHKMQPWKIMLAQTSIKTQTAGRIKKIKKFLKKGKNFFISFRDGFSTINLVTYFRFYNKNKKQSSPNNASTIIKSGFWLGLYPRLSKTKLDKISTHLHKIIEALNLKLKDLFEKNFIIVF